MRRLFRNRQGVVGCEATPDQLTIAHVAAGKRPTVQALHQVPNPGLSVSALRNLAAMAAQAPAMALLLAADRA